MSTWRKHIERYRVISWLLLAVLLLQLIFPLHFHLHHEDNTDKQGHAHVIDSHLPIDDTAGHHLDEGAKPLQVTPDIILKKNMDVGFVFVLFTCLILLLPAILAVCRCAWQIARDTTCHLLYYELAPPLRAPPAL